jgi:hypothetical protein
MGACMIVSVFLTLLFPVCGGLWPLLEGIPLARGGPEDVSKVMTQDRKGVAWRRSVAAIRD